MEKSKYSKVKTEVIEKLTRISKSWGFKEGHGKIFGMLSLHKDPASMKEISTDTGYSISAISMHLDLLQRLGVVSKVKKGRTFLFAAERDFIQFYKNLLTNILKKEIHPLEQEIAKEIEVLGKAKDEEGKALLKALRKTKESVGNAKKYIMNLLEVEGHDI